MGILEFITSIVAMALGAITLWIIILRKDRRTKRIEPEGQYNISELSGMAESMKQRIDILAGIADYLDMPVALVRVIFIISILTWPTLIIAYFVLYFWLDRNLSTEKVYDWLSGSAPTRHLKNLDYRRPLYRNTRNRVIAGVCSGVADYLEVKPVLVRGTAILAAFILGPYALLGYAVCWFVMDPNPAPRFSRRGRRHSRRWNHYSRRKYRHGFSSSRHNSREEDEIEAMASEAHVESMADFDSRYDPEPDSVTVDLDLSRRARNAKLSSARHSDNEKSVEECADIYFALENRMRELEAFITSKKFRLHCEISRI